ncbi:MAG: hypothetical protein A2068_11755 [Ignavibacteria bacterium GWB2_35_6b]|nr:MAG: hypothetical protein A2068_11755 [Ignavibacteria bacterium GWB2_35_6b]
MNFEKEKLKEVVLDIVNSQTVIEDFIHQGKVIKKGAWYESSHQDVLDKLGKCINEFGPGANGVFRFKLLKSTKKLKELADKLR